MAKVQNSKTAAPKVSVLMPMFNGEKYVEIAVRALMNQTFTDFELVILDDGSSDGSPAIVDRLAAEDSRIQVIHMKENAGSAKVNNHGIAIARGQYIAYTDADDISEPEKLAKQVAYLDSHPDIGLVATQYWKLSPEGVKQRKTRNAQHNAALQFHLLFAVPFCHPTIMYRRELGQALLPEPYDPNQKVAADFGFFTKMAAQCKFHVLPDYLFAYRVHPGGTSRLKKQTATETMLVKSLDIIFKRMPALKKERQVIENFIRLQRVDDALTAKMLKDYLEGLNLLRESYIATLADEQDKAAVNAFCCELATKTLLGRYRIYKKPQLVLRWLTDKHSQLKFLPRVLFS